MHNFYCDSFFYEKLATVEKLRIRKSKQSVNNVIMIIILAAVRQTKLIHCFVNVFNEIGE